MKMQSESIDQRSFCKLKNLYVIGCDRTRQTIHHWFGSDEERIICRYYVDLYTQEAMTVWLRMIYDTLARALLETYGESILPIVIESGTVCMTGKTYDKDMLDEYVNKYAAWKSHDCSHSGATLDDLHLWRLKDYRGWPFAVASKVQAAYAPEGLCPGDWPEDMRYYEQDTSSYRVPPKAAPIDTQEDYMNEYEDTLRNY